MRPAALWRLAALLACAGLLLCRVRPAGLERRPPPRLPGTVCAWMRLTSYRCPAPRCDVTLFLAARGAPPPCPRCGRALSAAYGWEDADHRPSPFVADRAAYALSEPVFGMQAGGLVGARAVSPWAPRKLSCPPIYADLLASETSPLSPVAVARVLRAGGCPPDAVSAGELTTPAGNFVGVRVYRGRITSRTPAPPARLGYFVALSWVAWGRESAADASGCRWRMLGERLAGRTVARPFTVLLIAPAGPKVPDDEALPRLETFAGRLFDALRD